MEILCPDRIHFPLIDQPDYLLSVTNRIMAAMILWLSLLLKEPTH